MGILGIDVGTSSTKCTLFTQNGTVIYQTVREYDFLVMDNQRFEIEPMMIWNHIQDMIQECSKESNMIIEGIAVSSIGETAIYLDSNDSVVRNSILYTDSRGDVELDEIVNNFSFEMIKEKTGVNPSRIYSLVKLLWIKKNEPENFNRIDKLFQFSDFISYMLTGLRSIDYSLATRTMGFNITQLDWDAELLNYVGVDENIFSKPVPTGTLVGNVTSSLIDKFTISKTCKVFIGSQDQIASTVGALSSSVNTASLGLGSVSCITTIFNKFGNNTEHYPIIPFLGSYATYAFNFSGGSLIKWFTETFCKDMDKATLFETLELGFNDMPSDVMVLPHFSGSGTPYMDRDAQGIIYGMTLSSTRSELYQAILEGIAYELLFNIEKLKELNIFIKHLNVTGGGSKSNVFCQILSDVTGLKINQLNITEAGTVGNFAYVAVGLHYYETFNDALNDCVHIQNVYTPSLNNREYIKSYKKYERMYKASKYISLKEEL